MKAAFFVLLTAAAMAANGGMSLKRSDGQVLSIDGNAYRLDFTQSSFTRRDARMRTTGDRETASESRYEPFP